MSLFDARKERLDVVPIWVHLPFLLVDFWSREIFSKIGNTMGTLLDVDMSFLASYDYVVACIFILETLREGLAEDMELVLGGNIFKQWLEYKGVPFRCRRCHKQGHIVIQFPLPFIYQNIGEGSPST
jgi:hypothetical protein